MTQQTVQQVLSRAQIEPGFVDRLSSDFENTLLESGYQLEPPEKEYVKRAVMALSQQLADFAFEQKKLRERMAAQIDRANDLGNFSVETMKKTFRNASFTFRIVTWMNVALFSVGIGLFILAAVYGVIADRKVWSIAFAGMGGTTFAGLFLLKPIDKAQTALSNLLQAQVAFMSYYEQLSIWETYAFTATGTPPGPNFTNLARGSEELEKRTEQAMKTLQEHLETK